MSSPPADPGVGRLRRRLPRIERGLVRTLAARERVQHELRERKGERGFPMSDPEQEERVRRRAREWAIDAGTDADLAETVVVAAVVSGKTRFLARAAIAPSPTTETSTRGRRRAAGVSR